MKWRSLEELSAHAEMRSLREIFAERKELIARYVPAEIQAVHARAVNDLRASGIENRALQRDAQAPAFELPDQSGRVVRSADLLNGGKLVICFIRGRWCPFCVAQIQAMNAIVPHLGNLNTSLVAISPQTAHQSQLMADQHQLQFPILSDVGNSVARQFGLLYEVPEYQREIYRRAFVNLPFINGTDAWELPIPAIYILAEDGSVIFAQVNADYTNRPEPGEIQDFLSRNPS
jgi:peroxiredoxin